MYANKENLRDIEAYLDQIDSWGYGSLLFDKRYKWAQIMRVFHSHFGPSPVGLKIVDVGGGLGPLDLYFSKFGSVVNFDLSHDSTWFCTDAEGLLPGAAGPIAELNNLERVTGNFLVEVNELSSKSVDFAYDSCSMIHLRRGFAEFTNTAPMSLTSLGLVLGFSQLYRILKESGKFAFSTDVVLPGGAELKDMVDARTYIGAAEVSGLVADEEASTFDRSVNRSLETIYSRERSFGKFNYEESHADVHALLHTRWPTTTRVSVVTTVFSGSFTPGKQVPALNKSFVIRNRRIFQKVKSKMVLLIFNSLDSR